MTATSTDGRCTERRVVAVIGLVEVAEGTAEEVDGLALEAKSDVCVVAVETATAHRDAMCAGPQQRKRLSGNYTPEETAAKARRLHDRLNER